MPLKNMEQNDKKIENVLFLRFAIRFIQKLLVTLVLPIYGVSVDWNGRKMNFVSYREIYFVSEMDIFMFASDTFVLIEFRRA